jgi:hypothetical protein
MVGPFTTQLSAVIPQFTMPSINGMSLRGRGGP